MRHEAFHSMALSLSTGSSVSASGPTQGTSSSPFLSKDLYCHAWLIRGPEFVHSLWAFRSRSLAPSDSLLTFPSSSVAFLLPENLSIIQA